MTDQKVSEALLKVVRAAAKYGVKGTTAEDQAKAVISLSIIQAALAEREHSGSTDIVAENVQLKAQLALAEKELVYWVTQNGKNPKCGHRMADWVLTEATQTGPEPVPIGYCSVCRALADMNTCIVGLRKELGDTRRGYAEYEAQLAINPKCGHRMCDLVKKNIDGKWQQLCGACREREQAVNATPPSTESSQVGTRSEQDIIAMTLKRVHQGILKRFFEREPASARWDEQSLVVTEVIKDLCGKSLPTTTPERELAKARLEEHELVCPLCRMEREGYFDRAVYSGTTTDGKCQRIAALRAASEPEGEKGTNES